MKKKIIYLLVTLLVSFNVVNAAENTCSGLDIDDLPTLSMSSVASEHFARIFMNHFSEQDRLYYSMSLDGHRAFCIDRGLPAKKNDKYRYVGECTDENKNMAFGFYISGDYPGTSSFNWAITQSVMWNGLEESLVMELMREDPAFSTTLEAMEAFTRVMAALKSHRGEQYYIWENVTRSDGQRMMTDLQGCVAPEEGTCPRGKMVKSGDSLSCYTSKGGNSFYFKN